jgi:hypothetical protein
LRAGGLPLIAAADRASPEQSCTRNPGDHRFFSSAYTSCMPAVQHTPGASYRGVGVSHRANHIRRAGACKRFCAGCFRRFQVSHLLPAALPAPRTSR